VSAKVHDPDGDHRSPSGVYVCVCVRSGLGVCLPADGPAPGMLNPTPGVQRASTSAWWIYLSHSWWSARKPWKQCNARTRSCSCNLDVRSLPLSYLSCRARLEGGEGRFRAYSAIQGSSCL